MAGGARGQPDSSTTLKTSSKAFHSGERNIKVSAAEQVAETAVARIDRLLDDHHKRMFLYTIEGGVCEDLNEDDQDYDSESDTDRSDQTPSEPHRCLKPARKANAPKKHPDCDKLAAHHPVTMV